MTKKNEGHAQKTRIMHLRLQKLWKGSLQNHLRYIDKSTGLFSKKYTEERDCPSCKSSSYRVLFNKSGGTYVACSDCDGVYLNPVFKDEVLEEYYRKNHTLQGEMVSEEKEFFIKTYIKGLKLIQEANKNKGNILDVGCSIGTFLDLAKKNLWDCYGLELNTEEASIAKSKGHKVQNDLISNAKLDIKFDVITLWDVFEHIKDGIKFIEEIKQYLNRDGIIFIQAPTRDALAAKILQAECNMFDGLEHCNLYGINSLNKICNATGLEIVSFETIISEIGVMNNYLNYENPYIGKTQNSTDIMNGINEEWINNNKLGYKFQTCLRLK